MNTYIPDNWVVLKIKPSEGVNPFFKVLAGWTGGYTQGDSWRINSGISRVEQPGDDWNLFYGASGSCYECHQNHYGLRITTAGIYNQLIEKQLFEGQIILMPENTDWLLLDY